MRSLTTNERFDQMMVTESNRDYFMEVNTGLPFYEMVDPGIELVEGMPTFVDTEWTKVYQIRPGAVKGWKM